MAIQQAMPPAINWGADGPGRLYGQDISNAGNLNGVTGDGGEVDPRIGMDTFAMGQTPGQYKALGFNGDVMVNRPYDPNQNADTIGGQVVNPEFTQWLAKNRYTPVSASDESGMHGALRDAGGNIVKGSVRQWGDGSDDAFAIAALLAGGVVGGAAAGAAGAATEAGGVGAAGGGAGTQLGAQAIENAAVAGASSAPYEGAMALAGEAAGGAGGAFDGLTASEALNTAKQGYQLYNTANSLKNGNYLGAATGALGAYTGYAGPSEATSDLSSALKVANAAKDASQGNYLGAAGQGLGAYTGMNGPSDTTQQLGAGLSGAGAINAAAHGNYAGALNSGVGAYTGFTGDHNAGLAAALQGGNFINQIAHATAPRKRGHG